MLLTCSKVFRYHKDCRKASCTAAIELIVGVCAALFFSTGIGNAQSTDAQPANLFPLNIVFLSPTLQDVTTIGNFNTGPLALPFADNQLTLDVQGNLITLDNAGSTFVTFPVPVAAIQLTTTNSRDISSVVESLPNGAFDLEPGALEFGDNVVRIDLAGAQIGPDSKAVFTVSANAAVGAQAAAPVPLPPSLPVFVSGLVALALVRFSSRKWKPRSA